MGLDEKKKQVLRAVNEMSPITIPELVEITDMSYDIVKRLVSTLHANGLLCKGTAIKDNIGGMMISWKIPQGKIEQVRDYLYKKE